MALLARARNPSSSDAAAHRPPHPFASSPPLPRGSGSCCLHRLASSSRAAADSGRARRRGGGAASVALCGSEARSTGDGPGSCLAPWLGDRRSQTGGAIVGTRLACQLLANGPGLRRRAAFGRHDLVHTLALRPAALCPQVFLFMHAPSSHSLLLEPIFFFFSPALII